jgi:hypothetical protein
LYLPVLFLFIIDHLVDVVLDTFIYGYLATSLKGDKRWCLILESAIGEHGLVTVMDILEVILFSELESTTVYSDG